MNCEEDIYELIYSKMNEDFWYSDQARYIDVHKELQNMTLEQVCWRNEYAQASIFDSNWVRQLFGFIAQLNEDQWGALKVMYRLRGEDDGRRD